MRKQKGRGVSPTEDETRLIMTVTCVRKGEKGTWPVRNRVSSPLLPFPSTPATPPAVLLDAQLAPPECHRDLLPLVPARRCVSSRLVATTAQHTLI